MHEHLEVSDNSYMYVVDVLLDSPVLTAFCNRIFHGLVITPPDCSLQLHIPPGNLPKIVQRYNEYSVSWVFLGIIQYQFLYFAAGLSYPALPTIVSVALDLSLCNL